MKIAIIGAGLSGLACAHELKRNGIIPTIFEKKNHIGEVLDLPALNLQLFNPTIRDPLSILRKKYWLNITPHYKLNEIIMVAPSLTRVVKGNIGFILLRGREEGYLSTELGRAVNLPVNFSTLADVNEIKNDYDYVVVANGTLEVPLKMNLAKVYFDAYVRIASILGEFNVNSIKVWMNTSYAKHGYAYLVPVSQKEARLVLIVNNIELSEIDMYWDRFLYTEKVSYQIIETKDLRHIVGHVYPIQTDNMYFIGNAGGMLDSLLGFGTLKSLLSGAMAAECILKGWDYNKKMQFIINDIKAKYEFRKVYDTFNNKNLDSLVTLENLPVIQDFLFNKPIVRARHGSVLAKTYYHIKK